MGRLTIEIGRVVLLNRIKEFFQREKGFAQELRKELTTILTMGDRKSSLKELSYATTFLALVPQNIVEGIDSYAGDIKEKDAKVKIEFSHARKHFNVVTSQRQILLKSLLQFFKEELEFWSKKPATTSVQEFLKKSEESFFPTHTTPFYLNPTPTINHIMDFIEKYHSSLKTAEKNIPEKKILSKIVGINV